MSTEIRASQFNDFYPNLIANDKDISNWPVVYILNNDREAYIGETVNMFNRASQHLTNDDRRRLSAVHVIRDDTFNKSVILDLESYLIRYMSADERFLLQNGNRGITNHNYYDRDKYEAQFDGIWTQLKQDGLVSHSIEEIENSDLFKYSPYKALSTDQFRVMLQILVGISQDIRVGRRSTTIVSGAPGTGKTVLAIYMLKLLADNNAGDLLADDVDELEEGTIELLHELRETLCGLKIGLVIPMQALRETIYGVVSNIRNLDRSMILKPTEIADVGDFDLLLVDEAHRLHRKKALAQYPKHNQINEKLGLGENGTELQWIRTCSKHQVFFYDPHQSVRPSDISPEDFNAILREEGTAHYSLNTQFRCKAGNDYIQYIANILSDAPSGQKESFGEYELKMFTDPNEMIESIKAKDAEYGLCRNVAGYAWKWVSKKDRNASDFLFGDHGYQWNTCLVDWVNSVNAVNEIGCIHTVQGYDLNYTGVIIGKDVYYDKSEKKIKINRSQYFDNLGKAVDGDMELLRRQILNIYYTLLTRGIRGTYIYVCDDALREYFAKYV